jgi:polyphosphate kinase
VGLYARVRRDDPGDRYTARPPWWIVGSNDKKAARINCLTHLLQQIPYEKVEFEAPKLGKRQKRPAGCEPDRTARNLVPSVF